MASASAQATLDMVAARVDNAVNATFEFINVIKDMASTPITPYSSYLANVEDFVLYNQVDMMSGGPLIPVYTDVVDTAGINSVLGGLDMLVGADAIRDMTAANSISLTRGHASATDITPILAARHAVTSAGRSLDRLASGDTISDATDLVAERLDSGFIGISAIRPLSDYSDYDAANGLIEIRPTADYSDVIAVGLGPQSGASLNLSRPNPGYAGVAVGTRASSLSDWLSERQNPVRTLTPAELAAGLTARLPLDLGGRVMTSDTINALSNFTPAPYLSDQSAPALPASVTAAGLSRIALNLPDRPSVPSLSGLSLGFSDFEALPINFPDLVLAASVPIDITLPVFSLDALPILNTVSLDALIFDPPDPSVLAITDVFNYAEGVYTPKITDLIITMLRSDLQVGGYGIDPTTEQALWERGRDREAAGYLGDASGISRQFAARGFRLPPLAMAGLNSDALTARALALGGVNREIALKRADMYVQARQFAITQGIAVEQMFLTYSGAVMERALNAAKLTVQFGLELFDAKLKQLNVNKDLWQTLQQTRFDKAKVELEIMSPTWAIQRIDAQVRQQESVLKIAQTEVEITKTREQQRALQADVFGKLVDAERFKLEMSKLKFERATGLLHAADAAMKLYKDTADVEQGLAMNQVKAGLEIYDRDLEAEKLRITSEDQKARLGLQFGELRLKEASLNVDRQRAEDTYVLGYADVQVKLLEGQLKVQDLSDTWAVRSAQIEVESIKAQTSVQNLSDEWSLKSAQTLIENVKARTSVQSVADEWSLKSAQTQIENVRARVSVQNLSDEWSIKQAQVKLDSAKTKASVQEMTDAWAFKQAQVRLDSSKTRASVQEMTDAWAFKQAQVKLDSAKTKASVQEMTDAWVFKQTQVMVDVAKTRITAQGVEDLWVEKSAQLALDGQRIGYTGQDIEDRWAMGRASSLQNQTKVQIDLQRSNDAWVLDRAGTVMKAADTRRAAITSYLGASMDVSKLKTTVNQAKLDLAKLSFEAQKSNQDVELKARIAAAENTTQVVRANSEIYKNAVGAQLDFLRFNLHAADSGLKSMENIATSAQGMASTFITMGESI